MPVSSANPAGEALLGSVTNSVVVSAGTPGDHFPVARRRDPDDRISGEVGLRPGCPGGPRLSICEGRRGVGGHDAEEVPGSLQGRGDQPGGPSAHRGHDPRSGPGRGQRRVHVASGTRGAGVSPWGARQYP